MAPSVLVKNDPKYELITPPGVCLGKYDTRVNFVRWQLTVLERSCSDLFNRRSCDGSICLSWRHPVFVVSSSSLSTSQLRSQRNSFPRTVNPFCRHVGFVSSLRESMLLGRSSLRPSRQPQGDPFLEKLPAKTVHPLSVQVPGVHGWRQLITYILSRLI